MAGKGEPKTGGRKKGSTNKNTELARVREQSLKEMVLPYCQKAVDTLTNLLDDDSPSIRHSAATTLLDRGFGKSVQAVESKVTVVDEISTLDAARRALFLLDMAAREDTDQPQAHDAITNQTNH